MKQDYMDHFLKLCYAVYEWKKKWVYGSYAVIMNMIA